MSPLKGHMVHPCLYKPTTTQQGPHSGSSRHTGNMVTLGGIIHISFIYTFVFQALVVIQSVWIVPDILCVLFSGPGRHSRHSQHTASFWTSIYITLFCLIFCNSQNMSFICCFSPYRHSDFLSFCSERCHKHVLLIYTVFSSPVIMTTGKINEACFVLIAGLIIVQLPLMACHSGWRGLWSLEGTEWIMLP